MQRLQPSQAKGLLTEGGEIAFIDVREFGQYGEGHPFFAINIPYSRLELDVSQLIPRHSVRILLLDDNDGIAERAAARLGALGYNHICILDGGAAAWASAGYTLFKGVNVPSKAFGELVEQDMDTPYLTVEALEAKRRSGENLVLLDGRSPQEFQKMTIPGAQSCPNAELLHRLPVFADDPDTTIVVSCAGRTRSIIGAQSLRNLGLANSVFALKNGTQGWILAGLKLERGSKPGELPALDAAALAVSSDRAADLASRFDIPRIDREVLTAWQDDSARTLYLFDVRSSNEYTAGHLPGASHAPGGQLVQATDHWVAVRGARIVLSDDTGLRAANTALWLRAMGHDVYVLNDNAGTCATSPKPAQAWVASKDLPVIAPDVLTAHLEAGAQLIDLSPGMEYRDRHIKGAAWAIRPALDNLELSKEAEIILVSLAPGIAELVAIDLMEGGYTNVYRLDGKPDDWRSAGLSIVASPDQPGDEDCIDYLFFVHSRHEDDLEACRRYLEWEINLLNQVDAQEVGTLNPPREATLL